MLKNPKYILNKTTDYSFIIKFIVILFISKLLLSEYQSRRE